MGWKDTIAPISNSESPSTSEKKSWKDTISDIPKEDKGELSTLFSDPGKYAKDRIQDAKDEIIGAGQGITAGLGDEFKGGADTALDALKGNVDPTNLDDIKSAFRKHQKENEAEVDAAHVRSPYAFLGSELVGGLLPGFLTAGGSTAVTGANTAKTLGQIALQHATTAGLVGGIAGVGGSHGNIDSVDGMTEMAKDGAFGAGAGFLGGGILGAASPYAGKALSSSAGVAGKALSGFGNVLKKPGNALAQLIEDSPTLRNLNDARLLKKDTGQSFTGAKNIKNTNDNIKAIVDDAGEKTKNLRQQLQDYYGGMLDDATAAGDKLSTDDQDLMQKMKAAKELISGSKTDPQVVGQKMSVDTQSQTNPLTLGQEDLMTSSITSPKTIPGKEIAGRGGMSQEMQDLLALHGTNTGDSLSNSAPIAINPKQAKTLQNALRETAQKPGYKDSNVLPDLIQKLTPAIDDSMTGELLPTTNAKYKDGMNVIEDLLNKGQTDPNQQKVIASELTPDEIKTKVVDYLKQVVDKRRDSNIKGGKVSSDFDDVLSSIKDANKSNQTEYLNPDHLDKSIDQAALQSKILKSIYGERANSQNSGLISKASDLLTSSPMRTALGVGGLQRTVNKGVSSIASGSRSLFNSTNESLSSVVQTLTGEGHVDIANSLSKSLTSGDNGAKNAALFTIMQNPNYRKAVFGSDDDSEGTK